MVTTREEDERTGFELITDCTYTHSDLKNRNVMTSTESQDIPGFSLAERFKHGPHHVIALFLRLLIVIKVEQTTNSLHCHLEI